MLLINARHSLGLTTRLVNLKLGDHSFLSENTGDRVRKLAGTFIEGVQSRFGIKNGSDHFGLERQDMPVGSASERSNSL